MSAAGGAPGAPAVGGSGGGMAGGMAAALIAAAPRPAPPPRAARPAPFYPRIVREFDDGPDEEPMLYVRR